MDLRFRGERSPALTVPPAPPGPDGDGSWWSQRLEVAADAAQLASRVAELLLVELRTSPGLPLGLATGRTMVPVYAALVAGIEALPTEERLAIAGRWRSFNLDEYVGLPPEDPRSFTAAMRRDLAGPLALEPGRLALPDGLAEDPSREARRYGAALDAAGGIGLQLLGLGENGHVGFNEPPCSARVRSRCVTLSAATRRQNASGFGGDPAAVPGRAITLGLADILRSRRILLVVSGPAKAAVLRRLLEEPPGPSLPASWLKGHPGVRLIVDRAALEN
jgi:glucosamine-6-phosphate deaminase